MRQRDKRILSDLARFRCMSRDHIAQIHFAGIKRPVNACNSVMKRLVRDGHVEVKPNYRPYVYTGKPSPVGRQSQKTNHFLAIVDFYCDLRRRGRLSQFTVEPKYSGVEPDIFTIWNDAPFFVEIQRSIYSEKVMAEKFARYVRYAKSGAWKTERWQPKNRKVFPYVWLITDRQYRVPGGLRVFQTRDVAELLDLIAG